MCWDVPFPPEEGGAGTYAEMSERAELGKHVGRDGCSVAC